MTSPPPRSGGFSLLELLCSMAIGALLLLAAAALLGSSGSGYERVGAGVATDREARALIRQLTADLAGARFHKDTVFGVSDATWAADRLGFLSLHAAQSQSAAGCIGDLCAVHYYPKDLAIGGKVMRCLMRGCRESGETFKALADDTVATLFEERPLIDEPIACGVISFTARAMTCSPAGEWLVWEKNDLIGPAALEIRLVLARRGLAARLAQSADWDGAGAVQLGPPSAVARNADLEVYATRISFGHEENR